ncbi:MAG: carbohydrate ABC transporter substrate-binding protein [Clostridiales bacterium]|nr:carbohydrate ABC transporter substrate-binding protein [Clostridiales bacterium]
MGKKYSRYISCILMLSIMTSVFMTGCSKTFKNGRAATIICDDDEPWYVSETTAMANESGEFIYYSGFYNGNLYSATYLTSYNGVGNDYAINCYDKNGVLTESVLISSIDELDCSDDLSSYCSIESACFSSGYVLFGIEDYNEGYKNDYLYNVVDHSVTLFAKNGINYGSVSESYHIISQDEYHHAYYEPEDGTVYIDYVVDGEVAETVDLGDLIDSNYGFSTYPSLFFEDNILQFSVVNKEDEGSSYVYQEQLLIYDSDTKKISKYYDQSDEYDGYKLHSEDGEFVYKTNGIYMKSGEDSWDCIIPFDRCDVVSSTLIDSYIISYTEDELDYIYFDFKGNSIQPYFTKITKIDSNPHVGKELIKAAFIDYISTDVEKAIYDFNSENEQYYIALDHRYDDSIFVSEYGNDEEDLLLEEAELQKEILADFKSGESADLYFGMSSHYMLQNEKYLEDLSYMAEKDFSVKSYLTNIFDASKSLDGKLYSIPIGFMVEGLSIENNLIDTKGFTYDSYADVVKNDFSGIDPLNYVHDKTDYFLELFENQPQLFFDKKGKLNIDGSSFSILAEYINENVPDNFDRSFSYTYGDSNAMDYDSFEKYSNMYHGVADIITYLDAVNYGGDKNMLAGLPSERGDGLVASISDCVSISVDSGSKEGCWDFIKYVLGTPVQSAFTYEIPVNLDAIDEVARANIDDFNSCEDTFSNYYYYKLSNRGVSSLDYDVISDYIDLLSDIKRSAYYDPEIIYIVEQEISDYFDGQVTLDQAIGSIEDRANKVYDD